MKQNNKNQSFSNLNSDQLQELITCMTTCKACCKLCVEEGNKKTAVLCNDCAEICDLAIKWKCENSEFCDQLMPLCAQVCKKCADACASMQVQHCQECAQVCKRCCDAVQEKANTNIR